MGLCQLLHSGSISINIVLREVPILDIEPHRGLQPDIAPATHPHPQHRQQRSNVWASNSASRTSFNNIIHKSFMSSFCHLATCNPSGQQRHRRPSSTQQGRRQQQQTSRMRQQQQQQHQCQQQQVHQHQQQHHGVAVSHQWSSTTHHRALPSSSSSRSTTTSLTSTWTTRAEQLNINNKMPGPKHANLIINDGEQMVNRGMSSASSC